ncbi:hypothetical protein ACET3Z_021649 [Daucus carota]
MIDELKANIQQKEDESQPTRPSMSELQILINDFKAKIKELDSKNLDLEDETDMLEDLMVKNRELKK